MKAALIGLGMVAKTYGDAFAKTNAAKLTLVHARQPGSRADYLKAWPGPAEASGL